MPIKVTNVGTNQNPICDFLLVINTNLQPISCSFEDIADYCSNFGKKWPICILGPPVGDLRAMFAVHVRLIAKPIVDFLFVLIELFCRCYGWGATSEYRWEMGVFEGGGTLSSKSSGRRGRPLPTVNAVQLCH